MAEEMLADVEYRDIPGFEGYKVGDDGSIWTCRQTRRGMTYTWRKMKGETRVMDSGNTYIYIPLRKNKKTITLAAHRVVLLAFVGPCPEGCVACHANDNGSDNRLVNLRWDTTQNNIKDRSINKRTAIGENAGIAKMTNEEARLAIAMIKEGWNNEAIARHIGKCGANAIGHIRTGKSWKWAWDDFVRIPCKCGTGSRRNDRPELTAPPSLRRGRELRESTLGR